MDTDAENDYSLSGAMKDIFNARYFIIGGGVVGLIFALAFSYLAVPKARCAAMVVPRTVEASEKNREISSMHGFVGVSADPNFVRFEKTVNGVLVAEKLFMDPVILDGVSKDVSFAFMPHHEIKSSSELYGYLKQKIRVSPVDTTSFRRITYNHNNSDFALYMIESASRAADDIIREDALAQAEKRISYLKDTISKTAHPQEKKQLVDLLMEQEHKKMTADMNDPYSHIMAEPASVIDKKAWPKNGLLFSVFMFSGCLLGFTSSAVFLRK